MLLNFVKAFENMLAGNKPPAQTTQTVAIPPRTSVRMPHKCRTKKRVTQATTVYDSKGVPKALGGRVGSGGEGVVHELAENSGILVKIYHSTVLAKNDSAKRLKEKIDVMRLMSGVPESLAWPKASVFDGNGTWIGYGMRRINGWPLQTLCVPRLVQERIPNWTRVEVVDLCRNVVKLFSDLHTKGVIVGDINPANFLFDESSNIYGMDCDSYQVTTRNGVFPCEVGIPMFLPPEMQGLRVASFRQTEEQLNFTLAMLLFRILMMGAHPYSCRHGEDPVGNLKNGKSPYGPGQGQLPRGPWYNIWSHLPYKMKSLFIQTFRAGHSAPCKRPALCHWADCLNEYAHGLRSGWHCHELMPATPKTKSRR